jgi:TolB-like protein
MKPFYYFNILAKTTLILAVVCLFSGCASKPVPPNFSLYGYQRLAVVPFVNNTQDPALAGDLQDELVSEIANIGALPVIDAAQVSAFLQSIGSKAQDVPTDEGLRQKIADHFKCDLLLVGSAEGYTEFLKDEAPCRGDGGQWGFTTERKVIVTNNARLMDPASGGILWSRNKNWGSSWHNTWNPLPVPPTIQLPGLLGQFVDLLNLVKYRLDNQTDVEPASSTDLNPSGALIYPQSRAFARLRQKAIVAAVGSLVDDFQGHCGWTPALLRANNGQ